VRDLARRLRELLPDEQSPASAAHVSKPAGNELQQTA
jgi:hypothetical protein